jgi:hypothetical protein
MIIQAFKFGTFSKIPEFTSFQRKLNNSIQKAITNRQIIRLELMSAYNWIDFLEKVKKMDTSSLSIGTTKNTSPAGMCPFLSMNFVF